MTVDISRRRLLELGGVALLALLARPVFGIFTGRGVAGAEKDTAAPAAAKWAMVVDIGACRQKDGCQDCVDACHRVHNVPDLGGSRQEIKWVWKTPFAGAFPEQSGGPGSGPWQDSEAVVMCNHCENPPCARVCPTGATWKREDGIVMMDYHRCIGCRYCMAACPYGARSFNWRDPRLYLDEIDPDFPTREKGVVEKCNFCEERLAGGLAPACVAACGEKALVFGNLDDPGSEISRLLGSRYAIRRRPEIGTSPKVFYLV